MVPMEEFAHRDCDLLKMGLKSKVACEQKRHGCVGNISLEGFGAGRDKVRIAFAPDGEQRRLCASKVFLKLWMQLDENGDRYRLDELERAVAHVHHELRINKTCRSSH